MVGSVDVSKELALLQIVDQATWAKSGSRVRLWELEPTPSRHWEGSAQKLSRLLLGEGCSLRLEARQLLSRVKVGRVLGRLRNLGCQRIGQRRSASARWWSIAAQD